MKQKQWRPFFEPLKTKEAIQQWLANDPIRRDKVIQKLASTGDFDLIESIKTILIQFNRRL